VRREQEEHTISVPEGVGWQPIPGQDFATAPIMTSMETYHGPFGNHSLASLGVQLRDVITDVFG
jgi:hypothetical protein